MQSWTDCCSQSMPHPLITPHRDICCFGRALLPSPTIVLYIWLGSALTRLENGSSEIIVAFPASEKKKKNRKKNLHVGLFLDAIWAMILTFSIIMTLIELCTWIHTNLSDLVPFSRFQKSLKMILSYVTFRTKQANKQTKAITTTTKRTQNVT